MTDRQPTVIIRYDEDGDISYHVHGDVRFFIIDEQCPHDRVYEYRARDDEQSVRNILGPEPYGHSGDERHAALVARVEAYVKGDCYLKIVEDEHD